MALLSGVIWIGFLFCGSFAIDCYSRTGGVYTTNGSTVSCSGSPNYCYSFNEGESSSFAGCSPSDSACTGNPTCVVCSTDYCNSVTPSTISCYNPYYGGGNGSVIKCITGISTCYLLAGRKSYEPITGGCGTCTGDNCRMCNTSYCNNLYPSAITCYYRYTLLSSFSSQGNVGPCLPGVATCYSYTDNIISYGGCGVCNSNSYELCPICSTNLCNTHLPSRISCFYRSGTYVSTSHASEAVANGTLTQCSTAVTTCYRYQIDQGPTYYYDYSGCGVCNASAPSVRGCSTCTSSSCNYFVHRTDSTSTLVPATATMNRISSGITSTQPALTSTILNSTMTITMLQSVTSTRAQIHTTAVPSATSTINYTNSVTSTKNGATSTSTTTAASSFTPTIPGSSTRESPLKCFRNLGETKPNMKTNITCTTGSCFQFSFAHLYTDYYFAGCGNCSQFATIFVNCLTCHHDYCNSAPHPVLMVAVKLLIVACLLCCLALLNINSQL